jgi:hypothetical protein
MDPLSATPQVGEALTYTTDFFIAFGTDLFIFAALAALVAVFAFYYGRDRLTPLVAGCYAALALYEYFPFQALLGGNLYLEAGVYIVFMVIGLVAFSGLASWLPSSGVGFLSVLLLSAIIALFMMAIAVNVFPGLWAWSAPTLALFSADKLFWWILAPLIGVFILGR